MAMGSCKQGVVHVAVTKFQLSNLLLIGLPVKARSLHSATGFPGQHPSYSTFSTPDCYSAQLHLLEPVLQRYSISTWHTHVASYHI